MKIVAHDIKYVVTSHLVRINRLIRDFRQGIFKQNLTGVAVVQQIRYEVISATKTQVKMLCEHINLA